MRGKVPTEHTDYTEAYGINISEFTERIDAARHTTESTELIACVATPRLSIGCRLWQRKALVLVSPLLEHRPASIHFCGFLPREA